MEKVKPEEILKVISDFEFPICKEDYDRESAPWLFEDEDDDEDDDIFDDDDEDEDDDDDDDVEAGFAVVPKNEEDEDVEDDDDDDDIFDDYDDDDDDDDDVVSPFVMVPKNEEADEKYKSADSIRIRRHIEQIKKFMEDTVISLEVEISLQEYIKDLQKQADNYECALQYKDLEGKYAKYTDDSHLYNTCLMKIRKIEGEDIYMDILVSKGNWCNSDELHIYRDAQRNLRAYDNRSCFTILTKEEFEKEYRHLMDDTIKDI